MLKDQRSVRNGAFLLPGGGKVLRGGSFFKKGSAKPLRMPLQANDGQRFMNQPFGHAVIGGLDDGKREWMNGGQERSCALWITRAVGEADALMVRAVDRKAAAVQIEKKRAADRMSGMKLVTLFITVRFGGGKMLDEIAAEIQADQLHAFADAQDWLFFFHKKVQKRKLTSVQFGIDVMTARIERRSAGQKQRIEIAAAGQDQRIPAGSVAGREGNLDFGHGTELLVLNRVYIIVCQFGQSGDSYDHFGLCSFPFFSMIMVKIHSLLGCEGNIRFYSI